MKLGAHVPTRGRLSRAIDYAREVGAEAIQLFLGNPRAWAGPPVTLEEAAEFEERRRAAGISPVVVHASYLVNIASTSPEFVERSVLLARQERAVAGAMGADGLVVHAGSGGGEGRALALARASSSVRAILEDDGPPVILELTAGGTGTVASRIPEVAELIDELGGDDRLGICLDTCHLLSAGYPLDDPAVARRPFDELRGHGLAERLRVLHANDSRDARGSRRDRHAHVGQGTIGEAGFAAVLADPALAGCAVLIETPGHEEEDRQNLATLRRLAAG